MKRKELLRVARETVSAWVWVELRPRSYTYSVSITALIMEWIFTFVVNRIQCQDIRLHMGKKHKHKVEGNVLVNDDTPSRTPTY